MKKTNFHPVDKSSFLIGGGGESCPFSGDAPLRHYQWRPLPQLPGHNFIIQNQSFLSIVHRQTFTERLHSGVVLLYKKATFTV